ncbi:MAG: Peptidase family M50 [Methanocella sp. PtaU1.Bin125]|nr:MAG: Peptidase family M50 [Methanocella sp. PtaU1.Bin125]
MLDRADLEAINKVFRVYETREEGDFSVLFGEPLVEASVFHGELYPYFSRKGKAVQIEHRLGEFVVVIGPAKKDRVWINVVLAVATFLTTMLTGAMMEGVDPFAAPLDLYKGLPFAVAIMLVLGSHEIGHYIVSRRNGVDATLPYFIPFPLSPIGTMGAIIRQKGPIPTRKALFDVGISGPLVGLVVAVAVTVVGLMLPAPSPVIPAEGGFQMMINTPLLFDLLGYVLHPGETLTAIHPIAFAGWVGMLVTVLNLIPVGQLDGGHVARAVLGPLADKISRLMPMGIMALGLFVTFGLKQDGEIWILWGLLTSFMSMAAHPKPTDDKEPIGWQRIALAGLTLVLAILCFTPAPFYIA